MFSRRTGQTIRALKPIWPFNSWIPIVGGSRSADRHAPHALPTAEDVLKLYGNLPTQLSVPEILQLNRYSHFGILSKARCHLRCKPVKAPQYAYSSVCGVHRSKQQSDFCQLAPDSCDCPEWSPA